MAPRKTSKAAATPVVKDHEDYDEEAVVDTAYDLLVDAMEKAQNKNARSRIDGLKKLNAQLAAKASPDFIARNRETLLFVAGRPTNKQEKEAEQHAILLGLVAVQAGSEVSSLMQEPMEQMRTILMDSAKPKNVRTACANSLALINRFCVEEPEEVAENLRALRFAWEETSAIKEDSIRLITSALAAWSVVMLDGNSRAIRMMQQEDHPKIFDLLSSAHVEVRLAAAEALGHLHEFMLEARPGFKFSNHEDVMDKLYELQGDFSKKTSKSDRRLQRRTIKEITEFMAGEQEAPEESVNVGFQTLRLDSFGIRFFYSILCDTLGGGISQHLMFNEVLREEFELGGVCLEKESVGDKKMELSYHYANDKIREKIRSRDRDGRSKMTYENGEY